MIKRFEAFAGENFSGGLVTSANPFELDENQSPNVMNCYSDIYKNLFSRKGYTKITETETAGTNYGMYDFDVRPGNRKLMVNVAGTVYKMENLDGTLDSLQTGLPSNHMDFTELNKVLVFKSWSASPAYHWDGIAAAPTAIIQFPMNGVNPIQWNQHVFYFTSDYEQNKLKYSTYNSYLLYDPANFYYTFDGAPITALETVRGKLIMFKANGIDRATYLGGLPLLDVKNSVSGVGCVARQTIKKAHTRQFGEVLFFATTDDRIVMFNGSEIKFISDPINRPNNESPFKLQGLSKAYAVVDTKRNWYICFFGDYGIIYDYDVNSWWPFDNQGFEAATWSSMPDGGFTVVTAKDGYIYRWWDGDSDDGDAIVAYWDSPHISMKQPHMLKKGMSTMFNYGTTSSNSLKFQSRLDFTREWSTEKDVRLYPEGHSDFLGEGFKLGTSKLGGKMNRDFSFDIREEFYYYQYRIKQEDLSLPFRINRGSVYQKSEGLELASGK